MRLASLVTAAVAIVMAATVTLPAPAEAATSNAYEAMPNVIGFGQFSAHAEMYRAQLYFKTTGPGANSTAWTRVVGEIPAAGTMIHPFSTVILEVTTTPVVTAVVHPAIKKTVVVALHHAVKKTLKKTVVVALHHAVKKTLKKTVVVALHHAVKKTLKKTVVVALHHAVKKTLKKTVVVALHHAVKKTLKKTVVVALHHAVKKTLKKTVVVALHHAVKKTLKKTVVVALHHAVKKTLKKTVVVAVRHTGKRPVVKLESVTRQSIKVPSKPVKKKVTSRPALADFRVGVATWYSYVPGRCATWYLPMGTRVNVEDLDNGRVITCVVTDREASHGNRVVDLSETQFSELAPMGVGVVPVRVTW